MELPPPRSRAAAAKATPVAMASGGKQGQELSEWKNSSRKL